MAGAGVNIGFQFSEVKRNMSGNMCTVYNSQQSTFFGFGANFFYRENQSCCAGNLADKNSFGFIGISFPEIDQELLFRYQRQRNVQFLVDFWKGYSDKTKAIFISQ